MHPTRGILFALVVVAALSTSFLSYLAEMRTQEEEGTDILARIIPTRYIYKSNTIIAYERKSNETKLRELNQGIESEKKETIRMYRRIR